MRVFASHALRDRFARNNLCIRGYQKSLTFFSIYFVG